MSLGSTDGLALYIHWPFCVSKCPYCDFNSHVRDTIDAQIWHDALLADMAYEAECVSDRPLTSIFFGGGTPSLMPPSLVAALIEQAERLWGFASNIEITLEANPNSVETEKFRDLAQAGVNRVSLGIQALDDETLAFLGRAHSAPEALAALARAQASFERVSMDIIYARPGQSLDDWQKELDRALSFGTDHLSLYQLTIEPGTRFETLVRKGELVPLDDDQAADLYALTRDVTAAAGRPAYEISNHAAPGQESRHNLTYWRYGDYLGIGPGAHGRRNAKATERHKKPENFLSAVQRNHNGMAAEHPLDSATQATEAMLMGLRLAEGIDISALAKRFGLEESALLNLDAVQQIEALELLSFRDNVLQIAPKGMVLLDALLREIIAIEPLAAS